MYCVVLGGTSPPILPRACDAAVEGRRQQHNRTTLAELFLHMLRYYAEFPLVYTSAMLTKVYLDTFTTPMWR